MEHGRPVDPAYIRGLFQVIRKQGWPLPELSFQGLRHSAASLMLAGSADISTVSKLLGRASISIRGRVCPPWLLPSWQRAVDGAAAVDPNARRAGEI
jgi:integrase